MNRIIVTLLLIGLLSASMPPRAEAMGKGRLALIAGATVAAGVCGIMVASNGTRKGFFEGGPKKWTPAKIASASAGSGVLVGGLLYVGLSVKGGKIKFGRR